MENITEQQTLTQHNDHNPAKYLPDMGTHLILDFNHVETVDLNDYEKLDSLLREVLSHTHVAIVGSCYKKFDPQGVTILYLLAESHFSIHTWPELKCCAIDFYHCGPFSQRNLRVAEEKLCDAFGWKNATANLFLKRGNVSSYLCNDFYDRTDILKNVKLLFREVTPFQEMRVYDTISLGRILVLDEAVQISTECHNYTIDMSKAVVKSDTPIDHVVIIGGGDLIIGAYIIKNFPLVKKVTICEIDGRVVDCVREYFVDYFSIRDTIGNDRLEVVIEDGSAYMKKLLDEGKEGSVGAVVIDCTDFALDEDSIAASLFTPEFYNNIFRLLGSGCGFVQQITKPFYEEAWSERVKKGGFDKTQIIFSQTPEYGGELPLGTSFKN
jgi:S-adenosylmethionine decarboxylase proenzyme